MVCEPCRIASILVLQPNFRGSTGYGKAFVEKGVGQWGRAMYHRGSSDSAPVARSCR